MPNSASWNYFSLLGSQDKIRNYPTWVSLAKRITVCVCICICAYIFFLKRDCIFNGLAQGFIMCQNSIFFLVGATFK